MQISFYEWDLPAIQKKSTRLIFYHIVNSLNEAIEQYISYCRLTGFIHYAYNIQTNAANSSFLLFQTNKKKPKQS